MKILERLIWSWPERLWLRRRPMEAVVAQERLLRESLAYIWLNGEELDHLASGLAVDESPLVALINGIYRPLIAAENAAPLPVVVYLALGYLSGAIEQPRHRSLRASDRRAPENLTRFIAELSKWIREALALHDWVQGDGDADRVRRTTGGVEACRQFVRWALSPSVIGPATGGPTDPSVCDGLALRATLSAGGMLEARLRAGASPVDRPVRLVELDACLDTLTRRMDAWRGSQRAAVARLAEPTREVHALQRRALRAYRTRAGVAPAHNLALPVAPAHRLINLPALSGYQIYGTFAPERIGAMLLEQLRKRMLDPTLVQRAQESTVDGVARRGSISQALKYQFALQDNTRPPDEVFLHVYERYFNNKMLYLRRVNQRSRDISLTLLVLVDLSPATHRLLAPGLHVHTVLREVCAYLIQDSFQTLWQIPRLYAEAVIVFHSGERINWHTVIELADGSGQSTTAQDAFLSDLPAWLRGAEEFSDDTSIGWVAHPPDYFQFLPAGLRAAPSVDPNLTDAPLADQLIVLVRHLRQMRRAWIRPGRSAAAQQTDADLLVSVIAGDVSLSHAAAEYYHTTLQELGVWHQLWLCDVDELIRLRLMFGGQNVWASVCNRLAFQRQEPGQSSMVDHPEALRQAFVREILAALLALYSTQEVRL